MRSTSQKTRQMKAAVEAILFAMGGSVEVEKIAAALEMKVESTEELLADMMEQYKKTKTEGFRSWSWNMPISSALKKRCMNI